MRGPFKAAKVSDHVWWVGAIDWGIRNFHGSPTINNNMFPTVADVMTYLKGLKSRDLVGAVFGSYGWSGEVVEQVREVLSQMKVDPVEEGLKIKYVPEETDLGRCVSLGTLVAGKLKEKCS